MAVLAAVAAAAVVRRGEVAEAVRLIAHVDPLPLVAGAGCVAASLLCFAGVWRWLLDAGGARWPLRRAAALTLGANAVAGAFPGGAVLATAWAYRQLRRRAVDPTLAAAVLAVAGALSALGLGVLGAIALLAAGPPARTVAVRSVVALLVVLVPAATAVVLVRRSATVRRAVRRLWGAAARRHEWARDLETAVGRVVEQAWNLRPGLRPWLSPAAQALFNWAFDLACLVLCMRALNIAIPWPGVLAAYVLTQIPASLRLTPGNLGVVEAGLAALLAAYGVPAHQALAATLLYRAVSFWAVQPVGWACCAAVTLRGRRR
ncbi:lysylphosphatidylglycerol synthase transmembrane domain-containing protein [Actinacidiphila acididurans]|uniref:lysylphosphatidylglycerol synthase transmembrane domain-containing protein n=1 Tax=Actinacidiphila acididurans TaxID=2784346 RepID=UPI0027DC079F|nr:lysylphosphatidylglycerol synthase transmembrane domain-containing protein [Actinacidiphila acididurans]